MYEQCGPDLTLTSNLSTSRKKKILSRLLCRKCNQNDYEITKQKKELLTSHLITRDADRVWSHRVPLARAEANGKVNSGQ